MATRTRIKLCGLTRPQDVQAAIDCGADALGFNFYPRSARYVPPQQARALVGECLPFVTAVGLFVNASSAEVLLACAQSGVNMLQFHGHETAEFCERTARAVGLPYMRALAVGPATTAPQLIHLMREYAGADALLFDTASSGYGGSGHTFDWSILQSCKPDAAGPPVVLSGGLNALNVADAIARVRPYAVDVSSGIEAEDVAKGIKDATRIAAFCNAVRAADASQQND
jgi:phosphoribosylanthranilate isomerase